MKRITLLLLSFWLFIHISSASLEARTFAYIPSSGDGNVIRIASDDETIESEAFGDDPYGAAVTAQGDYLVLTRPAADSVTLVRTDDFTNPDAQVDILVGDDPRGVAIESRGQYAYVANFADDTVSEINILSLTVTGTFNVGDGPWGVAATYDAIDNTTKVYVSNHLNNSISVITDEDVQTISDVGSGPVGLALTPDGAYLYVALLNADQVAIIRTSDNTLVTIVNTDAEPWGVAVGSDGGRVYVTNSLDDTVTVIDAGSQSFLESYNVGEQPMGVACPKNGDFAYVVNQTGNSVSKIDIENQSVTLINDVSIDGAFALGAFIGGTPPAAPTDLSAVEKGYNKIDLSWIDNSSDELGFRIERRLETEDRYTHVATVGADETAYTDSGLKGGTSYTYRVRAYNEAADSDYTSSTGATTDEGRFSWCFIQALLD